jgi:hypothetical protein
MKTKSEILAMLVSGLIEKYGEDGTLTEENVDKLLSALPHQFEDLAYNEDVLSKDLYVEKHKDTINLWFEGNTYEINPERTDIEDGHLELKRKEEGK